MLQSVMRLVVVFILSLWTSIGLSQIPDYIVKWKNDTTNCLRRELSDSVIAYLEKNQPSKRWIKKHLGGKFQKDIMDIGKNDGGFGYLYPACSDGVQYDVQFFLIYIKKRKYSGSAITIIG
jgi:hypothetical protein